MNMSEPALFSQQQTATYMGVGMTLLKQWLKQNPDVVVVVGGKPQNRIIRVAMYTVVIMQRTARQWWWNLYETRPRDAVHPVR